MRDQLEVYKKLRQTHQREVLVLESRLQMEMNDHRRNLDKEYDQQVLFIYCTYLDEGGLMCRQRKLRNSSTWRCCLNGREHSPT